MYTACEFDRYLSWSKLRLSNCSLDGAFLADIGQNVSFSSPSLNGYFPPMVTHGTNHSWHHGRSAVGIEHLIVQGVPVLPELAAAAGCPCPWQQLIDEGLSWNRCCRLAGNAQNAVLLGQQLVYLLSRATLKKEKVQFMRRPGSEDDAIDEAVPFEFEDAC